MKGSIGRVQLFLKSKVMGDELSVSVVVRFVCGFSLVRSNVSVTIASVSIDSLLEHFT